MERTVKRLSLPQIILRCMSSCWPIATDRISMTDRRFRGIAEVTGPAACSSRSRLTHGNRRTASSEKACTGPGSARS